MTTFLATISVLLIAAAMTVSIILNKKAIPMSYCDTADYTNWPLRTVWYAFMMSAVVTAAFPLMKATDPGTQFLVWIACASALIAVVCTFGDEKIDFICYTIATIAFYLAGLALLLCNTWWLAVLPIGAFVYSVIKNDLHWRLYTTTAFMLALYIYAITR